MKRAIEPAKRAAAADVFTAVAHFMGLRDYINRDPGACAPGFMLPPASQVSGTTCFALPALQAM